MLRLAIVFPALTLCIIGGAAQPYHPAGEEKQQIHIKLAELAGKLKELRARNTDDALMADVEVYHKAGEWILRHEEEFYTKAYLANTLAVLDQGMERARELEKGRPSWAAQTGRLIRAYRSRVDGSVQPYGLVVPDSYDGKKPMRLDVVLHGRNATLNEASFIAARELAGTGREGAPARQDLIQLDIFGRTNNAYRWAGETDVFEALSSVQKRYNIDPQRIVLRGFSMGGAGAWHIGLHYPDRWAAMEAGAGFTETKRYARQDSLPPYQEAALRIYDAVEYALNAFNLPVVGYGGEDDAQLQASVNVREQLAREGLDLRGLRALFLVGPKTGHRFHPDSKRESDQFIDRATATALPTPNRIRFVTYTTRYNRCFWVTVDALEKHYERAEIDGERSDDGRRVVAKTRNVARLSLTQGQTITIDGQSFTFAPTEDPRTFEKRDSKWVSEPPARNDAGLRKKHGLQGPIDDAFLDSFLCVRPTGTPRHRLVSDYARQTLDRFAKEYAKWLRADPRIKDDRTITPDDIARHNLILFGDPASNIVMAQVAGKLPVRWTAQSVILGGEKFNAEDHVPVMIYPSPLNPRRYVVINSGHTFHEEEFRGTNALLFPRLGDYAVIRLARRNGDVTGEVALAGLFDERWRIASK